jgi:hypothetical protein
VTPKQLHLMRAAAHGADFPLAKNVRESMTIAQLADFQHLAKSSSKPAKKAASKGASDG